MSVWAWIAIGAASVVALSVLVGLAVAAVLASISREVSELVDIEPDAVPPANRANATAARV